ncbi:MAG: hypothetical protein ACI8RZ_005174 [Myxococcota bacterium]
MPIKWTKANRKKVTAIRHPHKANPPVPFPDPESGWAWLHAQYTEVCQRKSLSLSATDAFQSELEALIARLSSPQRPTAMTVMGELYAMTVTVNMQGAATTMAGDTLRALVAHWSGAGPAFPVQMGGGVAPFAYTGSYGTTISLGLEPLEPNPHGHKSIVRMVGHWMFEPCYFSALQAWLLRLSEADFQIAREAAVPLRAALRTSDEQKALKSSTSWSCVFSRDQAWVVEDVHAVLAGELREFNGPALLSSLTDPALALRFAREGRFGFIFPFIDSCYNIMENLGADALPVIEALHARARHLNSRQKRRFASVLKLARTAHPQP